MSHVRQQIRDYVVAGLDALATTGNRVFAGRTRPLAVDHQPTLLVYTRSETAERTVMGRPGKITRRCTLHLEGRVSTAAVPDDLLDTIAAEIEAGIAALIDYGAGTFFGGLVSNVQFIKTEVIAEGEGQKYIGGVQLEYLITYRTVEGAASAVA